MINIILELYLATVIMCSITVIIVHSFAIFITIIQIKGSMIYYRDINNIISKRVIFNIFIHIILSITPLVNIYFYHIHLFGLIDILNKYKSNINSYLIRDEILRKNE